MIRKNELIVLCYAAAFIAVVSWILIFVLLKEPTRTVGSDRVITTASASTNGAGSTAIIALVIVSLASLGSAFYARKQRQVTLRSYSASPSHLDSTISAVKRDIEELRGIITGDLKTTAVQRETTTNSLKELTEIVSTLRKSLDEKDEELRRFKRNYDTEVYRRFLRRVIDLHEVTKDATSRSPDNKDIAQLLELTEHLLDECSTKQFYPTIGNYYRDEFGVADNPRPIATDDPALLGRIESVLQPGYELLGGTTRQIVIPAKVVVYRAT